MTPLTAQQIAEILGTQVAAGRPDALVSGGVSTDTRKLPQDSLFVALSGENFNGNLFAKGAIDSGAAVVIVSEWNDEPPAKTAVIVVRDTLRALQKLAHWWRKQLDIPVLCITGSNGKTSTKDFCTAVLAQKYHVSATRGNLNTPWWCVPS